MSREQIAGRVEEAGCYRKDPNAHGVRIGHRNVKCSREMVKTAAGMLYEFVLATVEGGMLTEIKRARVVADDGSEVFTLRGKLAEVAKLGEEINAAHLAGIARLEAVNMELRAQLRDVTAERDAIMWQREQLLRDVNEAPECPNCDGAR